jgi:hypothetical protein
VNDERQAFEAWERDWGAMNEHHRYVAWEAWQAARAASPVPATQLTWDQIAKAGRVDRLSFFKDRGSFKREQVECVILTREDVRRLADAMLAAPPAGWKLVPVEPTEAMKIAGDNAGFWCGDKYRAMLAASPASPAQQPPMLDDEGRAMIVNSHHYTAANIQAIIDRLKAFSDPQQTTLAEWDKIDWRGECNVWWRVMSGLFHGLEPAQPTTPQPPQGAQQEPLTWTPMHEQAPPPDTECVVMVRYSLDRPPFATVDRWELQREDPTGMGGPTIETGYGWNDNYESDVIAWLALPPHPPAEWDQRLEASAQALQEGETR